MLDVLQTRSLHDSLDLWADVHYPSELFSRVGEFRLPLETINQQGFGSGEENPTICHDESLGRLSSSVLPQAAVVSVVDQ
jgi:hypothetical protein